ncbi:MAG TPA: hypothetical protein DDZ20_17300, partial [Hyphomonas sp.]|nr:hypothetical protein [Hyphomonas sp.]
MGDWTPPESRFSQLGLRLLTAALLIPAGLFVVWSGGWWLAAACALFGGIMAWEWAGMSGHPRGWLLSFAAALFCLSLPMDLTWLHVFLGCFGLALSFASNAGGLRIRSAAMLG